MVGVGTANGSTICAIDLSSNTNVTVWGSGTGVGLYHVTLSPDLISTCFGENSWIATPTVPFPTPACTLSGVLVLSALKVVVASRVPIFVVANITTHNAAESGLTKTPSS